MDHLIHSCRAVFAYTSDVFLRGSLNICVAINNGEGIVTNSEGLLDVVAFSACLNDRQSRIAFCKTDEARVLRVRRSSVASGGGPNSENMPLSSSASRIGFRGGFLPAYCCNFWRRRCSPNGDRTPALDRRTQSRLSHRCIHDLEQRPPCQGPATGLLYPRHGVNVVQLLGLPLNEHRRLKPKRWGDFHGISTPPQPPPKILLYPSLAEKLSGEE